MEDNIRKHDQEIGKQLEGGSISVVRVGEIRASGDLKVRPNTKFRNTSSPGIRLEAQGIINIRPAEKTVGSIEIKPRKGIDLSEFKSFSIDEDKEEKEKEQAGREEKGATEVSEAGLNFIARHESCSLSVYQDPVGIPTIGYGHKIEKGEVFDRKLEPEEAWDLLKNDAENRAARFVRHYVKVKLRQHQFDALTSFTFNLGCGRLEKSDLLKYVNHEEYSNGEEGREKIKADFMKYITAKGQYLKGLELRRKRELRLFLDGIYDW